MALKTQFELLLYSFLIGIYLGASYDLLYYFIFMHLKKVIKYICDICFFVIQAFIVFQVIYRINYGTIPVYSYIFICCGFIIYYHFAGGYYEKSLYPFRKLIYGIIERLLKILHHIMIKPFIDTYNFLLGIYHFVKKKLIGCGKRVRNKIKKIKSQKLAKKAKIIQNET